jgi:hypothetical protein
MSPTGRVGGSTRTGTEPGSPAGAMTARDLAYAGLFGAGALLLPVIFHLLQLGHALMPMYIPLAALPFLVRGRVAVVTALLVPLLSGIVTGMPPLYPPIAPIMALEMAFMSGLIATWIRLRPGTSPLVVLFPTLIAGRLLNFALSYGAAVLLNLPPWFAAGLSFIAGWPGVILMMIVVPPLVAVIGPRSPRFAR